MQKLFIVDGYSILFRTYYSVGEMTTQNQTPVGGVFGFIRAILMLIEKHSVEKIVIALDSGKKTFRAEMYEQYKANRISVPESLIPQFGILQEFLDNSNICSIRMDGYEADDIIATIVRNENTNIEIVTSDKDLMQLVDENVFCLDFFKNKVYKKADVIEKFGVEPKYIVDYLALIGDSSDNIPGVKGCGPKGAVKLIDQFGTIEEIIENCEKISNEKMKTIIHTYKNDAILSKKLASLCVDVPIPKINPSLKNFNMENMRKFLEKYEMKSLFYMQERLDKKINKVENVSQQLFQNKLL